MQPSLDVKPLAEKIAVVIGNGQQDEFLKWYSPNRVHVVIGKILPKGSAVKQTLEGRRKRLRKELIARLESAGWKSLGRGVFEKDVLGTQEADNG